MARGLLSTAAFLNGAVTYMNLIKSYAVPFAIVATWAVLVIGFFSELASRPAPAPAPVRMEESIVVVGSSKRS